MTDPKDDKNGQNEEPIEITSVGPADEDTKPSSEDEVTKWKNDYLYLRADFDNYRKSVLKERSELMKYGCERLLFDVLDVIDNFERALEIEVTPENLATFKEGIILTANELKKVVNRFGVNEIKSEGAQFDPSLHEALSSEETDSLPPGHVARVFKKAYKLHDRVIRPAQVVVSKEPQKS